MERIKAFRQILAGIDVIRMHGNGNIIEDVEPEYKYLLEILQAIPGKGEEEELKNLQKRAGNYIEAYISALRHSAPTDVTEYLIG